MSRYQPPPPYQPPQPYEPQQEQPYQPPRQQLYQPPQQAYRQQQQPYGYYTQQPKVQHVVHHYQSPPKSSGAAALLEVLPGFFFQTFGIGHIYAGNVGTGLLLMFGYWVVQFFNLLLCLVLVGFITLPACWLLALILSPILASNAATRANAAAYR